MGDYKTKEKIGGTPVTFEYRCTRYPNCKFTLSPVFKIHRNSALKKCQKCETGHMRDITPKTKWSMKYPINDFFMPSGMINKITKI
jgi:ssDNA-binding Zn-finger/Zn-ribbon topoisomerase 1